MKGQIKKWLFIQLSLCIVVAVMGAYILYNYSESHEANIQHDVIINDLRVKVNPVYQVSLQLLEDREAVHLELLEAMIKEDHDVTYIVTNPSGEIVYTNNPNMRNGDTLDLMDTLYYDLYYANQHHTEYRIAFPLVRANVHQGHLIVELSQEYVEHYEQRTSLRGIWVMLGVLFTLNLLNISLFFVYRKYGVRKPIAMLNQALQNVVKGIYKKEELAASAADFDDAFTTYNTMIEELSYLLKKQQDESGIRKRFVTMISHELKTPLSAMSAYVEGLRKHVAKDEETRAKYVQIIDEKLGQLNRQVEELFKHAQLESNHFKVQPAEHYAHVSFAKIFSSIEKQFEDTAITLHIDNRLPECIINMDNIRIEQVLQNLVNNAAKHIKEKGMITLTAYRLDNHITLEVADDGYGISPQDLPYIFDYFYQGKSSQKQDYQGVGLGLAICKDIIEKHGGEIRVKSSAQNGTVFYIKLPIV